MKRFFVYILFSDSLNKFYCGYCANLQKRIDEHNRGKGNFTRKGMPWRLFTNFEFSSKSEAIQLELKIKKRGIGRFLIDNNYSLPESSGSSASR